MPFSDIAVADRPLRVGLTLLTLTVVVSLTLPPSSSVTVIVISYPALSSGVNVKLVMPRPLAEANASPSLVTFQLKVKASCEPPPSLAEPTTVMGVPSLSGELTESMDATGSTLLTTSSKLAWLTPPSPSSAVIVTLWLCTGPSVTSKLHVHVPSSFLVTVPTDAERVSVSESLPGSDHVPLLWAV